MKGAWVAVAWQIDIHRVQYTNHLIVNWVRINISYPLLAILVINFVKDDDDKVAEIELTSDLPKVVTSIEGMVLCRM